MKREAIQPPQTTTGLRPVVSDLNRSALDMKASQSSSWAVFGLFAAILACIGFWVLAKTAAWSVWSVTQRFTLIGNLILAHSAVVLLFVHIARDGVPDGIAAGSLLLALGALPFGYSFHYLFLGPSYGGLIGGVGALIALLQFGISGSVVTSGLVLLLRAFRKRKDAKRRLNLLRKEAELGGTDNSGAAPRRV